MPAVDKKGIKFTTKVYNVKIKSPPTPCKMPKNAGSLKSRQVRYSKDVSCSRPKPHLPGGLYVGDPLYTYATVQSVSLPGQFGMEGGHLKPMRNRTRLTRILLQPSRRHTTPIHHITKCSLVARSHIIPSLKPCPKVAIVPLPLPQTAGCVAVGEDTNILVARLALHYWSDRSLFLCHRSPNIEWHWWLGRRR
jgi:hypothetical protein